MNGFLSKIRPLSEPLRNDNSQYSRRHYGNSIEITRPLIKLRTASCSHNSINLEWIAPDSHSKVTSYRLRRMTINSRCPGAIKAEQAWFCISPSSLGWIDNTVSHSTLYQYDLFLTNTDGKLSSTGGTLIQSTISRNSTPYEQKNAPYLKLHDVTDKYVQLQISIGEASYIEVYRSDDEFSYPIAYYELSAFNNGPQTLTDFDVLPGVAYSYCAIARTSYGVPTSSMSDVDVKIPCGGLYHFKRFFRQKIRIG